MAGSPTPLTGVAKEMMAGIRSKLAPHQVAPIGLTELLTMITALPHSAKGIRDRPGLTQTMTRHPEGVSE